MKRILAIGDIHGCLTALRTMDAEVGFREDDVIVTLGDYVDRGPDSKGVIDFLLELRERCQLTTLRGNHEIMMMEARQSRDNLVGWLSVGGNETMRSYGATRLHEVPDRHWEFIEATLPSVETETHFMVHANADSNTPLDAQTDDALYWEPFKDPAAHFSGKVMVCGHTSQKSGVPKSVGHAICIDTLAYGGGWLTCLELKSGHYWQTNEQGHSRTGLIEVS